ncbi:hypothetical protein TCDM_00752 [Trypanosoma cruzi Dm28c]|uniref:SUI1 domain-containing protein n=1 Tax=Trypanosoma cruzi Dm28c TaxID=1416333 RepID=V5C0H7_TRYCR|nr:hypothetical protein TCDM_00752 [Trypanosoma cruzi Dm28c]
MRCLPTMVAYFGLFLFFFLPVCVQLTVDGRGKCCGRMRVFSLVFLFVVVAVMDTAASRLYIYIYIFHRSFPCIHVLFEMWRVHGNIRRGRKERKEKIKALSLSLCGRGANKQTKKKKKRKKTGQGEVDKKFFHSQLHQVMLNNELANLVDQQKRSVQDALEAQKVHIRVQQRKGKKFVTSVQGLNQALNFRRISREFQRRWGCNGTVIVTPDAGTVIQLQGNWSEEIKKFLLDENMATEQNLEIHSLN